jgi:hypothetical protein
MKRKASTIRIYDDYATETAERLIDKRGEAEIGKLYGREGREGLRALVASELEPIGGESSDITAVCLVLEQLLDGYRYLPPRSNISAGGYSIYKGDGR